MPAESWLSLLQALQLLGLGPCILLMFFLLLALKEQRQSIVPLLFLSSLGAGFLQPLLPLIIPEAEYPQWQLWMTLAQGIFPAATFLLMIQFLSNRLPRPGHWLILLLPLLGGLAAIYVAQLSDGEICIGSSSAMLQCFAYEEVVSLYHFFTGALILLLVMPELVSSHLFSDGTKRYQQDKFWLMIGLILLTALLLAMELLSLMETAPQTNLLLLSTLLRLAFVFLMFASLFRTFANQFALAMERIPTASRLLTNEHEGVAHRLKTMLIEEKCYREMGLSRSTLAEKLGTSESTLSHIINRHFGCNLNVLLNRYRIEEAKYRLASEPQTPVTTIAFEVGFNSIPSFNRVFKEITGLPPTGWREKHGAKAGI